MSARTSGPDPGTATGRSRPAKSPAGSAGSAQSAPARATAGPNDPDDVEGSTPGVPDAARAVLSRVRSAARTAGPPSDVRPARPSATRRRRRPVAGSGFSGPGPDERDPMAIGGAWSRLVDEHGWRTGLDVARLLGMWPDIVGAANAEHATPESFDPKDGVLLVRTSSTAWAEQLRLMLPTLRTAIEAQVGTGVVREIRIMGPTPPRVRGRLRVRGRGPRDTYG